jgi:hypothetical protein
MKTIFKEIITSTADRYNLQIPADAELLYAGEQRGEICVWFLTDTDTVEKRSARLRVYGTGHKVDEIPLRYLGSAHLEQGLLIFHVFEDTR